MIRRRDVGPLTAVGVLLAVTAVWWALALWPIPDEAPAWVARARWVCFNATETGLPDRSGWILLIGQPLGLVALLLAGWGRQTAEALRHLGRTLPGRLVGGTVLALVLVGLGATGARVLQADTTEAWIPDTGGVPETYPRLDRPLPDMTGLVDQAGEAFSVGRLAGRPAIVTFAFGHCATVCPLVVANALSARDALADHADFGVVVLTLDPWRDTPSRLSAIAGGWGLAEGDLLLGGEVAEVEAALDAWSVARVRDERTGDVTHPAVVFLVEADGTVAYASAGHPAQIEALGRRLRGVASGP